MSKNRSRNSGMRRANIKRRFGSEIINGGERINTAVRKEYQQFKFNPSIPLPHRKQLRISDPSNPMPELKQFITKDGKINREAFDTALLKWHKKQNSPTTTTPMFEKLVKHHSGHFGIQPKEKVEWWHIVLVNTPLNKVEVWFNGFTDNSVHYFKWLDKISGIERESFTLTKSIAHRFRANGLKGIPWK